MVRKYHKFIGSVFAVFFLFAATISIPLFWRNSGVYGKEIKDLLVGLHTWEIGARYIGVILSTALIFMSVSGLIMVCKKRK
ncbi:MAG: hypothetical protein HQK83_05895 [Fibrobacteria bacterium]|nr:hypothetical protein [Fibrobacteria bacterium]